MTTLNNRLREIEDQIAKLEGRSEGMMTRHEMNDISNKLKKLKKERKKILNKGKKEDAP